MRNAADWPAGTGLARKVIHRVSSDVSDRYDRADRLKQAREFRGWDEAKKAAFAMGVPKGTYYGHESGSRGMKHATVVRYAKFFKVSAAWLWEGIGNMIEGVDASRVPVVGSIAQDGTVKFAPVPHEVHVEPPASINSQRGKALIVEDDTTRPTYRKGDHAFYDDILQGADIRQLIGKECVVCVGDGRTLIREIGPGSTVGLWSITLYGVPEYDIAIEWAAKVKHITRA